jgi:hypothetical protein
MTDDAPPVVVDECDQSGVICTVAGTGRAQFDGDGKAALETSFYFPIDIDFDADNRPVILDWNNFRIRRINDDGSIETIVGNGTEAAPIDGALARDTSLHHASDIAITSAGEMYVAGDHAPFVFRVGTDGLVFIVAGSGEYGYTGDGGPAREAAIGAPFGVALASDGGFYLADLDMNVVRHVDASGVITTAAGNGSPGYAGDGGPAVNAQLYSPTRVRMADDGNLYICDTDNNAIRRVDREGIITTVVGTGVFGYSGDGSPATQATLNSPYDMLILGDVMLIADTGNHVIRMVDADGVISTLIGTGVAGFSGDEGSAAEAQLDGPSSLVMDADGALWIGDTFNQRVRKVSDAMSLINAD